MAERKAGTGLQSHSTANLAGRKSGKRSAGYLFLIAALTLLAIPLNADFSSARGTSDSRSSAATFTQAKFDRAKGEGRLILIETYADWCAPCRIQAPIVERLRKERRYRTLILLRIDEETPRSVWRDLGLAGYGQFVVFRGDQEISRGSPLSEAEMRTLLSS